ncbi:MAG: T9SS type A sorting domain-containing protein [Bacteroidota bacterium]
MKNYFIKGISFFILTFIFWNPFCKAQGISIEPIAKCQDITIEIPESGRYFLTADEVDNGSIIPFPRDTERFTDKVLFRCSDIGSRQVVTLSIFDNNFNGSTCQSNVTVIDLIPPQAVCQDRTVQLNGNGEVYLSPADFTIGSTDNCGITGYRLNKIRFDCDDIGSHLLQLTLLDVSNNAATCEVKVEIEKRDILPDGFSTLFIGPSVGAASYKTCEQILSLSSTQTSSYNIKKGWGQLAIVDLRNDFSFSAELLSKSANAVAGLMVRESASDRATMSFVGMHGYQMTGGVTLNGNGQVMKTGKGRANRKVVFSVTRVGDIITFKQGRTVLLRVNVDVGSSVFVGVFLSSTNTSEATASFGSINYYDSSSSGTITQAPSNEMSPSEQLDHTVIPVSEVSPLRESAKKVSTLRGTGGGKTPQLNIWPNPANDLVNIDVEGLIGNTVLLNVYNITGELVKSQNLGIVYEARQQIDLATLEAGLYIIAIEAAGRKTHQKIVKK